MGIDFSESGAVAVDNAKCTSCGLCVKICPAEVLQLVDGLPHIGPGQFMGCIACGHCMAVCPTEAIAVVGRGMAPNDRIDLPPKEQQATADAFEALCMRRRSVRKFRAEPVPREVIERIVAITSTAPMGIPPHEVGVVVFDTPEKVRAFAAEAIPIFRGAARFFHPVVLGLMRPFIGKTQHRLFRDFVKPLLAMLADRWASGDDLFTYDAPAAMLFHHPAYSDSSDPTIAATYAMLAAESLGLGSCMLGTSVALSQSKPLKARYGIPEDHKVGLTLVLGYPAVRFHRGVRRRLKSVKYAE